MIVLVCNFCFSNSPYNKANIFFGLIEYELNSLLSALYISSYSIRPQKMFAELQYDAMSVGIWDGRYFMDI